jgi:hypothetical protein
LPALQVAVKPYSGGGPGIRAADLRKAQRQAGWKPGNRKAQRIVDQEKIMQNKFNLAAVLLVVLTVGIACSGGNQQAEANKIIDEANKKLEDARALMVKTEERNQKLFGADVKTVGQLAAYKERMKDEAKSIADDYEKVASELKEISKKYDEVSRLNVSDKYKEYSKIKSDEFAKRAEAINIHKGNAQAFIEITEPKQMLAKFEENNKKSESIYKDADDLAAKAKKIEEENKDLFKA